jgi:polyhydroxyalkanoate synthesis regulator protein
MNPLKEVLRIKKYRNRKLYNLNKSIYMPLADVLDHALSGGEVKVIDVSNGKDVTVSVLVLAMAKKIEKEPELMVLQHLRGILKKLNQGVFSKWIVEESDGE